MLLLINKIQNLRSRDFFLLIILLLFITDIVRVMNIPGLKEILPFIYFTIVPGLLIVILLNLNKLEFIKKFVLWVGLSLSFILLIGLGLNSFYPLISKPLSLFPLLFTFNAIIILLSVIAYRRNRDEFDVGRVFNFSLDSKDKLVSPMIFSIIFPFLAFFGTYLMNTANNNSLLLFMLFLVPVYFVVIIGLRNKISNSTYPFAILMVSLSFFLIHGLTSNYLIGRDNHWEFYCFNYTMLNLHWDQAIYNVSLNNCLSVTILPTIYSVLTSINGTYVFKVVFGFIGSIIPLIIYLISKNYFEDKYALLAALLVMFQMNFIELLSLIRQEFALIFLFLAIFVLFDKGIKTKNKKIIYLVLMISLVLSHYSTAFVGLVMTVPILLIPFFKNLLFEKKIKLFNFDILAILGVFSYIWYFIIAKAQSKTATKVVAKTTGSATSGKVGIVTNQTYDNTIPAVFGFGVDSIPQIVSVLVNDAIFLTIGIGLLSVLLGYIATIFGYKKYLKGFAEFKEKIPFSFLVGAVMSTFLLILFIATPFFSKAYGPSRIFLTCLVFLAPMFIIGGIKIAAIIKKPKLDIFILVILIISLFTVSMHFNYYFSGMQSSPYYDENSNPRLETYIYDQDIKGTKFLSQYAEKRLKVFHGDKVLVFRLIASNNYSIPTRSFLTNKKSMELQNHTIRRHYLYLNYANTQKNIIFEQTAPTYIVNSTYNYRFLKGWGSQIYDNGGSKILIP